MMTNRIIGSEAFINMVNNDSFVWAVVKLSGAYKYITMFI